MTLSSIPGTDSLCPHAEDIRETHGPAIPPQLDLAAPPGRVAHIPNLAPDGFSGIDPEALIRRLHSPEMKSALPSPDSAVGFSLADALLVDLAAHCYIAHSTAVAVVLWTIHTYAHDHRGFSPILAFTSDRPECGKSTVLNWLSTVVAEPFAVSCPDAKVLLPAIQEYRPTLLLDDVSRRSPTLNDILVSGHSKAEACLIAPAKKDQPVKRQSTWSPKAIAKIGALPDAVASRSIEIRMDCKPASLSLKRPQPNRRNEALSTAISQWVAANADAIVKATPSIPATVGNRLRDNWEPLLAIADLIGGDWPVLARESILKIRNAGDTANAADILLLNAVKLYFDRAKVTTAFTDEIVHWMNTEMNLYGTERQITARFLNQTLRHFNLPANRIVRRDTHTAKGLELRWLTNAFDRYLCKDPALPNQQDLAPAENLRTLEPQNPPPPPQSPPL